ncbi:hypothetical protein GCM10010363_50880 [Streptomyces omiyaensis]|nr:hypothetical protein GCM10010363_50880 [Streptomyces omiyaensis]
MDMTPLYTRCIRTLYSGAEGGGAGGGEGRATPLTEAEPILHATITSARASVPLGVGADSHVPKRRDRLPYVRTVGVSCLS